MQIRESKTPEGLPRVDWAQNELDYLDEDSTKPLLLFCMFIGFIADLGISAYLADVTNRPQPGMNPIAFIFFIPIVGSAIVLVIALAFMAIREAEIGKRVRVGTTDYFIRPALSHMFLQKDADSFSLCFTGSNVAKERLLFTARHDEVVAFSMMEAERWESSRKIDNKPYEKLLMAELDNGDTLNVVRHYGSEAELNELRMALKRNFIGWQPPRQQEDGSKQRMQGARRFSDLATPRAPRPSRLDDDDVI